MNFIYSLSLLVTFELLIVFLIAIMLIKVQSKFDNWVINQPKDVETIKKEVNEFLSRDRDLVVQQMNDCREEMSQLRATYHWYDEKIGSLKDQMEEGISASEADDLSMQLEMYTEEQQEVAANIRQEKKNFSSWSRLLSLMDKEW